MFNIILLGLTSFFTDVSSEMIYPLVPFFLTLKLGASLAVMGLIEGIAESVASLLKIFSGYISDRLRNRKRLTIVGYGSSAIGKLLLYIAAAWPMVLAGRVVDRLGKGIRTAPRDALIADSSAEGRRGSAFGLHRALDSGGAVVGVLLAYFFFTRLAKGEYAQVFLWSVVPAVIGVVLLFFVRETKPKEAVPQKSLASQPVIPSEARNLLSQPVIPSEVRNLLSQPVIPSEARNLLSQPVIPSEARNLLSQPVIPSEARNLPSLRWSVLPRKLKLFLAVALIFTLGNSSNTFLLLRADTLGFTPAMAILLYLVYNVVYAVVSYPAGRLSDKIGRKRLLVAGYAFYGLVYLGFALVSAPQQAWMVWALFGLYGLYIGFTDGVEKALVSDLAPANLRATAIGLHATIVGIGLFPASLIAGQLWDRVGPAAAFYFGGGMGLVAAIGLMRVL